MSTEAARPYRKRRRAEQEAATRQRITEAAVKLHGSLGPARTTVSDVAREAGVQRATVYRHFPTQTDLFAACSGHFVATNPPPDLEAWRAIRDPRERLRAALSEMYRYWERTEFMFEKTTRDAELVPAMKGPIEAGHIWREAATDVLLTGRPERGAARRRVRAAIAHALMFPTWQSLRRTQGLENPDAVALMAAMVDAAGGARR